MLTTIVLCAGLMLASAEPQQAEKNPPAAAVQAENSAAPATKTPEKPAEKTAGQAETQKDAADAATPADKPVENAIPKDPRGDKELLPIEANVISYTNSERARYGLPPLQVDENLMDTAREHCSWMTRSRIFQHTRRAVAENIAMGQPTSQDVLRSWMNSSGHRANILNPGHRRIGVSAYRNENGTIYWVQQFSP